MADKHTCIVLRLQRTIVQDAYIAVPVSDAIMKKEPEPDGSHRIDFEAFVREGIRLSQNDAVDWAVEESASAPHPVQQPVPADRRVFDVHRE